MTKQERIKDFRNLWTNCVYHEHVEMSDEFINWLDECGYFTAPASRKYHGAYEGGLYDHSKAVFIRLNEITENMGLQWQRSESPFIVGMFHDLCKCDQYIVTSKYNGTVTYEHNTHLFLNGHGDKSIMLLAMFLSLTEEEILCIRYHMGAYITDDWNGFDAAIKRYENVLYTHTADQLASKIDET